MGTACLDYILTETERQSFEENGYMTIKKRSLAGHPAYQNILEEYRNRLIARFREDGYEKPLDGETWRKFPLPEMPDAPDT